MLKWLDRLARGSKHPRNVGAASLRDYPPYHAPHVGPPTDWTLAQAEENLAHLVQHRAERLVGLGSWLRTHAGIDPGPALAGEALEPLLDPLHEWAKDTWPAWHRPALASPEAWLRSTRDGDEVVFSLLLDLALLFGELIMARHDGYRWALDLDPINERDKMHSWQRPVLKLPMQGNVPSDIDIDLEEIVVSRYQNPHYVMTQLFNPWARTVLPAATGQNEAFWLRPGTGS